MPLKPAKRAAHTCPGTAKTTGQPCRLPAGSRTDHLGYGLCALHGGMTPGARKQAQRLAAQDAAQAFGLPVEVTADEALEQELWRTAGTLGWLAEHMRSVAPEQRLNGEMAGFAALYAQERRHLTAVAKACADVGLDQRRVALLERTAEQFAIVLRAVLQDLDVLDDPRAPAVVQRHLAVLEAPASESTA